MAPIFKPPTLRPELESFTSIKLPNAPTDGHKIERTTVDYLGYWAAVIDYNHPSINDLMRDVRIICRPPNPVDDTNQQSKWGVRRYKVQGIRRRLWVSGVWKEHAIYESPYIGDLVYADCYLEDCGAQAIQVRHTDNRADPLWNERRRIVLNKVRAAECGQARGVGRAGFSISIKDMGPKSSVEFRDLRVRTINQNAVVVKNNKQFDSFGGVCVEYCKSFGWQGGYVGMRNPDRQPVQLFDFGRGDNATAGPEHIVINGAHIDYGGNILVCKGAKTVDIRRCKGDGRIQVMEWNGTKWVAVEFIPIANGMRRGW
jgi:hypothetical protein